MKSLHRRLDRRFESAEITLRGAVLNRKSDCTPKHFEAEIMVKLPKSRLPFVVKKKNKDFRTVLSDAADTMETALERDHEKSERSRKVIGQSHFPVWKAKQAATLPKKK